MWNRYAKRLGGLEVNDELKFFWPLHRKISGFASIEDLGDENTAAHTRPDHVWSISERAAPRREETKQRRRKQSMLHRQRCDLVVLKIKQRGWQDDKRLGGAH